MKTTLAAYLTVYPFFQSTTFRFKILNFSQPPYLSVMVNSSTLNCGIRLSYSSTRTHKQVGSRSIAVGASPERNKILLMVRSQRTLASFRNKDSSFQTDFETLSISTFYTSITPFHALFVPAPLSENQCIQPACP